jgi:hypothetical protein
MFADVAEDRLWGVRTSISAPSQIALGPMEAWLAWVLALAGLSPAVPAIDDDRWINLCGG